jgi:transposase-like protein
LLKGLIKEVKRRERTIEVFRHLKATSRILYLLSSEIKEKYKKWTPHDFSLVVDTYCASGGGSTFV